MFQNDDRLKGLPAAKEQVLLLHQSLNAPQVNIPGKAAGPVQAYVVGLQGREGATVFVYLFLSSSSDCAIYVSSRRNLPLQEVSADESDALAFAESMGFMMDDLHFRSLSPEAQGNLIKTLPVFQREPKAGAGQNRPSDPKRTPAQSLGRIFSAF